MDNFQPVSKVDPNELPEGFSVRDPNAKTAAGTGGPGGEDQQHELQKEAILAQALTTNALERLRRIKLVRSVDAVERAILQMAPRLTERINEGKLIEMLERGNRSKQQAAQQASAISIQRKKYNIDTDDEDDNDDDLM
jgi:DNA-binding TFAR19-related protein (PDSD5 family)